MRSMTRAAHRRTAAPSLRTAGSASRRRRRAHASVSPARRGRLAASQLLLQLIQQRLGGSLLAEVALCRDDLVELAYCLLDIASFVQCDRVVIADAIVGGGRRDGLPQQWKALRRVAVLGKYPTKRIGGLKARQKNVGLQRQRLRLRIAFLLIHPGE